MYKNNPLISIIMAAYNSERTIAEAIQSIEAQTYREWELNVINDCSTDSTSKILQEYSANDDRIHIIDNRTNMGASMSRKIGMEASTGIWIAILDSDDLWKPEKLAKQIDLAERTNADLVYTGSSFIDNNGKKLDWILQVPETITRNQLLKQNLISNSSVLVRKDLYQKYYVLGDQMHEDYAIWLNLLEDRCSARGINEPLLIYRLSQNSKSGNKLKAAKMNWNTYRNAGLNPMERVYYMVWYSINGILKYRHLR